MFNTNDRVIAGSKNIANSFNSYFTGIGPTLAKTFHKNNSQVKDNHRALMKGNYNKSMYLEPVKESEIFSIVTKFKSRQSQSFDSIKMSTIKRTILGILTPLTHICNLSFQSGKVPDKMKIAKVVPIYKSGSTQDFGNYRPISILPQFSKILEKVFLNRLIIYIEKQQILVKNQFGVRQKHSTENALVTLIENISDALDNNDFSIAIFLDLKKVFDTINHDILLDKMFFYGVRGIVFDWVKNYLSNRKQYMFYDGEDSVKQPIKCGVPQGSILGPILFILYINDLCFTSEKLKYILFADDTNLLYSNSNLNDLTKIMNTELCTIFRWFKVNKLSLNINKTNF